MFLVFMHGRLGCALTNAVIAFASGVITYGGADLFHDKDSAGDSGKKVQNSTLLGQGMTAGIELALNPVLSIRKTQRRFSGKSPSQNSSLPATN